MPSFLPVKPSFSVVVAFMLTCSVVIPRQSAVLERIASTCGLILGVSQMIVTSAFPMEYPLAKAASFAYFRNVDDGAPFH